jgi:hypothetical protein
MRYLSEHTSNQYLVATHSAHLLDTPGAAVFHVTHDGTSTRVAQAVRTDEVVGVALDLGYLASDLLQTNYTIWVEGPSDRLYWQRWLSLIDDELAPGEHYMIMNYGGKLAKYVSLGNNALKLLEEDLIEIVKLGRHCTVIADSDKPSADAPLSPTLQRLLSEADTSRTAEVLIPECRTVENLIPEQLLMTEVKILHPRKARNAYGSKGDPYAKPINGAGESRFEFSKVSLAHRISEKLTIEDVPEELQAEVTRLANRIRAANGMTPREA